jgi:predicted permease
MVLRLFSIIAPVFACAAIGYAWARAGRPYDSEFVTRLIMNVGAPFLIISSFSDAPDLDRAALGSVGLATLGVMALVGALAMVVLRAFRFPARTYLPSVVFPNTGNMGLPLCLFAFGQAGLSLAIVVFLVVATFNFSVGVAIVSGERHPGRLLRMPLLWAAAIAVTLVLTGWRLPVWVANTVHIMGGLTIPLMLLSLGVTLSTLRVEMIGRSLFFALLRYGFGFGAGLVVCRLLGLTGVARGVVILQAAMPPAVFNYMMAERYRRDPEHVAGIVVVSTVLSLAVMPVVLWFLLR